MSVLQEYKCLRCGGALEFDSDLQKMKCPFCDSVFSVEEVEKNNQTFNAPTADEINWTINSESQWQNSETQGLKVYTCKSCGGEIVADETTAASQCPFCANQVVMSGQFSGSLRPDLIIPFKKNKDDAKQAYKKHIEKKRLLPKTFKDENHIDEIKGIYVPFWLFDAQVGGSVTYEATKIRTWSDSNCIYTETSYYDIFRGGSVAFSQIPVDGSKKMPDDLMESIEPYDIKEAVDFKTAYLAGFLADRYDIDASHSTNRANARIKKSVEELFKESINSSYNSVEAKKSFVRVNNGTTKYALYPVWILNTTYKDKKYTFAMNGQSGKFVGNLPFEKSRLRKIQIIVMLCSTLGIYGLAWIADLIKYFLM